MLTAEEREKVLQSEYWGQDALGVVSSKDGRWLL